MPRLSQASRFRLSRYSCRIRPPSAVTPKIGVVADAEMTSRNVLPASLTRAYDIDAVHRSLGSLWQIPDRDVDQEAIDTPSPEVMEPPRRKSLALDTTFEREASYSFTANGAILLKGFRSPIPQSGLVAGTSQTENPANPLPLPSTAFSSPIPFSREVEYTANEDSDASSVVTPMNERVVLLGRLGEGATGVVYRAFDLLDLRLVAVKVIPVNDKNKRQQLVHELSSLFDGLTARRRRRASSPACKGISSPLANPNKGVSRRCTTRNFSWPLEHTVGAASPSCDSSAGYDNLLELIDVFVTKSTSTLSLVVEYMDGGSLQVKACKGAQEVCQERLHVLYKHCLQS